MLRKQSLSQIKIYYDVPYSMVIEVGDRHDSVTKRKPSLNDLSLFKMNLTNPSSFEESVAHRNDTMIRLCSVIGVYEETSHYHNRTESIINCE